MEKSINDLWMVAQNLQKQIANFQETVDTLSSCPEVRRKWIPRHEVMNFLGYADTQMAAFARKYGLTTSEVGKRKFYSKESLQQILDTNQKG